MTETDVARWRPVPRIRPIAIGIAFNGGRILAMRVLDDAGALTGVRPPGGAIEFGETAAAAVAREFKEEFGCAIEVEGAPLVLENLYEHHGARGHEIVFAFRVRLLADALYAAERLRVDEGDGNVCDVDWFDFARIRSGEVMLYPVGLAPLLP